MSKSVINRIFPLGFPWETMDPFLFCVFHQDFYPKGNAELGPDAPLSGRDIGQDFTIKDGWRMYHGDKIPGFPAHPHRGFETVTIVRQGLVDHSDSLGAAGRYGGGDVQWLTTGKGIQHCEMFPLLHQDRDNPLELFQIWLNLPGKDKMTEPHFKMLWRETIPSVHEPGCELVLYAGEYVGTRAPSPTPDSWAANKDNHVNIWLIKLDQGANWTLPACVPGLNRVLYFYEGNSLTIGETSISVLNGVDLDSAHDVAITNNGEAARLLLLQGKPIAEPVAQYGPFVMNTQQEIQKAFHDYHATRFGGWPWPRADQHHGAERGRFAKHVDGKEEEPGGW
jgi:redox-sensitive bicupin YhaK (pirin superfamily)